MSEKSLGYQDAAWQSFNTAFNSPTPEADRAAGHELYRQSVHLKLEEMDAKSALQNMQIDMAMGVEIVLPKVLGNPLPNIDMYG